MTSQEKVVHTLISFVTTLKMSTNIVEFSIFLGLKQKCFYTTLENLGVEHAIKKTFCKCGACLVYTSLFFSKIVTYKLF